MFSLPTQRVSRVLIALAISVGTAVGVAVADEPVEAAGPSNNDWLGIVNAYRSQSGLAPVSANASWSAGAQNHSCWMLLNNIAHDEQPGTPGYTADGDAAGNSSNVAVTSNVSATARSHIDLWMSGPFHAIGLLRSSLGSAGFGLCANAATSPWRSAATLDVVRGNNWSAAKPATPVVFPGRGATTSLTQFVAESPDPRNSCPGWAGRKVGLPLIALMPSKVTTASASLAGPNGPVATCVLHGSNTLGTASSILGGDNAVVVVPAEPLVRGTYSVQVASNGGNTNWSFNVDPGAPLVPDEPPPATTRPLAAAAAFEPIPPQRFADSRENLRVRRLVGGRQVRVQVSGTYGIPSDATAVSANFTVVGPDGAGFFTAFNCSDERPSVSTSNYRQFGTVANQAIVPLDKGAICLYSLSGTDIVIDVNGYVAPDTAQRFTPLSPTRYLDTRTTTPLQPFVTRRLQMVGGPSAVPGSATAVAINITTVNATADGWVRVFPCGQSEPKVSSVNPRYTRTIPNSAIVPLSDDGFICITSMARSDVVIDLTGWFGPGASKQFIPLDPIRLRDTRSFNKVLNPTTGGQMLSAWQVMEIPIAGQRGIPAGVTAATINIVAVGGYGKGWLRAFPCGATTTVSTVNFSSPAAVANGTNVQLSKSGSVCVVGMATTHVVVDVTGVWK